MADFKRVLLSIKMPGVYRATKNERNCSLHHNTLTNNGLLPVLCERRFNHNRFFAEISIKIQSHLIINIACYLLFHKLINTLINLFMLHLRTVLSHITMCNSLQLYDLHLKFLLFLFSRQYSCICLIIASS